MSYQLGQAVTLAFEVELDNVDTDTAALTLTIVKPDGSSLVVTPNHDGTGRYSYDYLPTAAGRHRWTVTASGIVEAAATGLFDVVDPNATGQPLVGVAPWTDGNAISQRPGCSSIDPPTLDLAAQVASDILWALSGRQYDGSHAGYVRPVARPPSLGVDAWRAAAGYGLATWGVCDGSYGLGVAGVSLAAWLDHDCTCAPPQIELGRYPITAITEVKIDGTVIPPAEYRVDDHRRLVRVKATAASVGTARDGWPTCQRLDLPDTQDGTFSVAFIYGTPPPASGVLAATVLGSELALAASPSSTDGVEVRLPDRVRSIVRQGESISLIDPQSVIEQGRTGIPEVDFFLRAVNPYAAPRRASAWSPDTPRTVTPTWRSS